MGEEDKDNRKILVPKRSTRNKRLTDKLYYLPDLETRNRWTDEEKKLLLNGLKIYGYEGNHCTKIAEQIPSRTPLEVMNCLKYWKRMARFESIRSARTAKFRVYRERRQTAKMKEKKDQFVGDSLSYVEMWIDQFIKKIPKKYEKGSSDSEGVFALSSALLVISQLEAHPIPENENDLDFKELYLWLYDLLNGNPMKKLSTPMMSFILETLEEMMLVVQSPSLSTQATYANYMASHRNPLLLNPGKLKTYHKPDKVEDVFCQDKVLMEELVKLPLLNPLNIQVDERIKKPAKLHCDFFSIRKK